jgi:hypothetical protein
MLYATIIKTILTERKIMLNWNPVVKSLAQELEKEGFEPSLVWDGGEYVETKTWDDVVENVCGVDESTIHMTHPEEETKKWIFIVLGNAPEEIACDYGMNERTDRAVLAHSAKWEGRDCPKK